MSHWANASATVLEAVAEFKALVALTGNAQLYTSNTVVELDRAAQICDAAAVYLTHAHNLLVANTVTEESFRNQLWADLLALKDQRDLVRPPIRYTSGSGQPDGEMDPNVRGIVAPQTSVTTAS